MSSLIETIVRRPYRRSAVDESTQADIAEKVARAQEQCQPVKFSVPFGGYKLAHLPHSPHLNWAEVFWLNYLRDYAEPIAVSHPAGVVFSFSYMSGVLSFINGYPAAYQALYIDELRRLFSLASCDRIRFELMDIADLYGGAQQALEAAEQRYQSLQAHWPVSPEAETQKLASAARNITSTEPEDIRTAAMRCDAMESLEQRRRFNKFGEHIQLSNLRGSLSLHLGSAPGTVVQAWVGIGALLQGKGRIISLGQWQKSPLHEVSAAGLALPLSRHLLESISPEDWAGLSVIPVD